MPDRNEPPPGSEGSGPLAGGVKLAGGVTEGAGTGDGVLAGAVGPAGVSAGEA